MCSKTVLTVLLWVMARHAFASDETTFKEAAVRDVFIKMLHITPPEKVPRHLTAPPKHMVELYHQYTKKGSEATVANTVRNILPTKEPPGLESNTDLLFFNVSTVDAEEEVRLAQLHLNRRKLHRHHHYHRRLLPIPYRIVLLKVTGKRTVPISSVPVFQLPRASWHTVDITVALRELLLATRSPDTVLGVKFQTPKGKTLSPKQFLRDTGDEPSPAFLVVFSEDSLENKVTADGVMPSPTPPVHTHAIVQKLQSSKYGHLFRGEDMDQQDNYPDMIPNSENANLILKDSYVSSSARSSLNTTTSPKPPAYNNNILHKRNTTLYRHNRYMARQLPQEDTDARVRRSIIDNELPDADPSPEMILKSPQQSNIIPPSRSSERRGQRGRKGSRHRLRKQKNILPPGNSRQNIYQEPGDMSGVCKLRKLTVNFADIGWDQFIIAPEVFEANYCAGSCQFPLDKMLNPTNHAILQTLLHSLCNTTKVPAPSCVPDHLSTITVMYMVDDSNVVLKNYSNMKVNSCACR